MLIHGSELVVDPPYAALFEGLLTPDDVLAKWMPGAVDPARRSRVAELRLPQGRFFLKSYDYPFPDRLRTLGIQARVRREYRNLLDLAALGMRTPRPVAYGQTRSAGFVTRSFLMTVALDDAVDLRELADGAKAPFPLPDRRERRRLIADFARRLRTCHDAAFFLHTAFFKNLMLLRDAKGYDLAVIDMPFANIWRNRLWPAGGRRRDLGCLQKGAVGFLTPGERMAFFKAYRGGEGRLGAADKALLREVAAFVRRAF